MQIEKEWLTAELFAEMLPLAQKCWEESTASKTETCAYKGNRDFLIEPDRERYLALQEQGSLIYVTLRDEGKLFGYVVGWTYLSMHHRKILCGLGDSIYVEPEYRSHTWALIKRFEKELADRSVTIIGWPVTDGGPVYEVLKAKGYVGDDVVMEKMLCALSPE